MSTMVLVDNSSILNPLFSTQASMIHAISRSIARILRFRGQGQGQLHWRQQGQRGQVWSSSGAQKKAEKMP